jgi:hypothetical protein
MHDLLGDLFGAKNAGVTLGLPDLRCTAPDGVKHKDCGGEVLG